MVDQRSARISLGFDKGWYGLGEESFNGFSRIGMGWVLVKGWLRVGYVGWEV